MSFTTLAGTHVIDLRDRPLSPTQPMSLTIRLELAVTTSPAGPVVATGVENSAASVAALYA